MVHGTNSRQSGGEPPLQSPAPALTYHRLQEGHGQQWGRDPLHLPGSQQKWGSPLVAAWAPRQAGELCKNSQ